MRDKMEVHQKRYLLIAAIIAYIIFSAILLGSNGLFLVPNVFTFRFCPWFWLISIPLTLMNIFSIIYYFYIAFKGKLHWLWKKSVYTFISINAEDELLQKEFDSITHKRLTSDLFNLDSDVSTTFESKRKRIRCNCTRKSFVILTSVIFLLFINVLICIASGFSIYLNFITVPKYSGTIYVNSIQNEVHVFRDVNYGIHVKASTLQDVHYGQGFITAQERLLQMELSRRIACGTLSEILGEQALPNDKMARTLNFENHAKQIYESMDPDDKSILEAYANGVNDFMKKRKSLPIDFALLNIEPKEWTPVDSIAIGLLLNFQMTENIAFELERYRLLTEKNLTPERIDQLIPPYPAHHPSIFDKSPNQTEFNPLNEYTNLNKMQRTSNNSTPIPLEISTFIDALSPYNKFILSEQILNPQFMSNSWIVSGNFTNTGSPLLVNDLHGALTFSNMLFHIHLQVASILNAVGATFPGLPCILFGKNDFIGWGILKSFVDSADLYIMEGDDSFYRYNGEFYNYTIREEIINIKDSPPQIIKIRDSFYGPVISDVLPFLESTLSLCIAGYSKKSTFIKTFLKIAESKSWDEFHSIMSSYVNSVPLIFTYGDIQGDIGMILAGSVPVRSYNHSGKFPIEGNGNFDWEDEYIPFDELPFMKNSQGGILFAANNKISSDAKYGYDFDPGFRAKRIKDLLEQRLISTKNKLTVLDMQDIQLDQISTLFEEFKKNILLHINPNEFEGNSKIWLSKLYNWNGDFSVQSKSQEATLFETWYLLLSKLSSEETGWTHWSFPTYILNAMSHLNICPIENCHKFAQEQLQKAIKKIDGKSHQWGENIHIANFKQLLPNMVTSCLCDRSFAIGGNSYTINFGNIIDENFFMKSGVIYRQIIDFSRDDNSLFIYPMGQSGKRGYVFFLPKLGNSLSMEKDSWNEKWRKGQYIKLSNKVTDVSTTLFLKKEK